MSETKNFSVNELKEFNGKNGKPAYVGYKGKVYEVTESMQWGDGDHMGHGAGEDLTDMMEIAPPQRRSAAATHESCGLLNLAVD
jgi:predicted heme/steroid binding protein